MLSAPNPSPLHQLLSKVYAGLLQLRQALYRHRVFKIKTLPCPVVVVGNVWVGGTGKTPISIALIQHLRQRGYTPGLVSRGYGRRSKGIVEVHSQSLPWDVGDEPHLIWQKTRCPVVVAADRVAAGRALLQAHPAVNIVVSDDGLQHYALGRDIDIVVQDERDLLGERLLPAGSLREPWPRQFQTARIQISVNSSQRRLDVAGLDSAQRYLAVAAIARPAKFFQALQASGIQLSHTLSLPDHADFAPGGRFDAWFAALPLPEREDAILLCTEKDQAKLLCLYPQLAERIHAVPMQIDIAPAFWQQLDAALDALPKSARSA